MAIASAVKMEAAPTNDHYFARPHRWRISKYVANQVGGSCFIVSAVDTVLSAVFPGSDLPTGNTTEDEDSEYVRTLKIWTAHFMRKYGKSGGYNEIVVDDILKDLSAVTRSRKGYYCF